MAKGNETTTKFKVDISELKSAMQEARKQVAYANSEFKEASSSMDDWSKSSDGISAKLKQLNSNLKSQETVLEQYEKTLEEVKKEYGENSTEAMEYATKLNNQKAVVNKIKKEISGYEDALQEVSDAEKIAAKTGQDVADVLADVGDEAEDAGDGFTTLKGAVATFAGNVLTSLVSGLKDAVVNLMSLSDETREYRDQMNKLNTAGTEAGYSVDYTKEKYKELYGVLADETATATTVSNFMAMGAEEETLNSLLNSSIGIWAKYGDSIPLDGLAESINETAKVSQVTGTLADALNWAGISEDEFNEKLAQCTTEQERQKLIADTLNTTYGGLSASYQQSNASIIEANKANADYTETLAQMGAKIEPVTTTLKQGFNELLQELLKLIGDVDMEAFASKIEEGFATLKDEVIPAIKEGFGWILDNKDTIMAGVAGIVSAFGALAALGIAQNFSGIVTAMKTWIASTKVATAVQWLFNAAMNANPIVLIVSLVGALVVALVTFIATNEDARAKLAEVWDAIKEKISGFVDSVKTFFTETIPNVFKSLIDWVKANWPSLLLMLINPFAGLFTYFYKNNGKFKEFVDTAVKFIKELPSKIWTWLLNTINKVVQWRADMIAKAKEAALSFINKIVEFVKQLPSKVWTWLLNTASKVAQWKSDLGAKAREAGQELLNKLIEKVKEIPDKIKSIGGDIVAGLWNGISDKVQWLKNQISGFVGDVTSWLKDKFEIGSPSKLMAREIGKWLPEGIAVGINDNAKSVLSAMNDLAVNTLGSARAGLQTATNNLGSSPVSGGVVNNFYQTINSPKQLSRLDIYRQSKNLLGYAGGGV